MIKNKNKLDLSNTINEALNRKIIEEQERSLDGEKLDQDISEEYREAIPLEEESEKVTDQNWSRPQDRGEDLINERDPFIQQPELDTQIPPELIQQRAYQLYEERGKNPDGDLADWFEAERQLRGEIVKRREE
jgi:hypothetical protein